jgi:putative ABC transport system permease protein
MTDAEGRDSSGVALINATMAKKLWSGADPLGRRFRFANDTTARAWLTVIGVVPDIRDGDIEARKPQATAYLPYPYLAARNTALMVRIACASPVSGCSPARITTAVRAQIRASDPALPVFEIQTMDEVRELGFWQFGLFSWMFSIFGVLALLLAAVGVYGVLSYAVSQRRHEIGVRVALGAGRRDVLRLVVSQGVVLALLGVGVGLLGAFGVTRVITSVLYDVSPSDPLSYVAVALFLTAIAFLASYIPARRAARVDPMVALRNE